MALAVGLLIGGLVGLLGVGGSIVTVPALMLLLGLSATQATGTSLVVVGIISTVGLITHARHGRVDWRAGLGFAGVGVPVALLGGRLSVLISDTALTLVLVALLAATAVWTWRSPSPSPADEPASWWRIVPSAAGVGLLTGTLGVGGGFVVIPGLVAVLGLSLPVAIGTSQLVLVANAGAGLLGRLGTGAVELVVGLAFAAGGTFGALLAARAVGRVEDDRLGRLLASVLAAAAVALLADLVVSAR